MTTFGGMPDERLMQWLNQQAKLVQSVNMSAAGLDQQVLEAQRQHLARIEVLANSIRLTPTITQIHALQTATMMEPTLTQIRQEIAAMADVAAMAPTIAEIQRDVHTAMQTLALAPIQVFEELRQAQQTWLQAVRYLDEFVRLQRMLGTNLSQYLCEQAAYYRTWLDDSHDAFTEAFVLCADYLLYQALRVVANTEDAQDIVQGAYEKALRQLQSFSVERILHLKVRPWLSKIVKTTALNVLRDQRRCSLFEETGWTMQEQQPGRRFDQPEAAAIRQELISALGKACWALPAIQRKIISMRYSGEGLSWEAIADSLDCPVTKVRVYHSREIKKLRQLLADQEFSSADY